MENALHVRVSARVAAAFALILAFLSRRRRPGAQKLTIMLIPHTEKGPQRPAELLRPRRHNPGRRPRSPGLPVLGRPVFRHRQQAGVALERPGLDAGRLDAIRSQTRELVTAAKRFENALSGTLGRIDAKSAGSDPPRPGDPVPLFQPTLGGAGSAREIGELQDVTNSLENSVDPLKELGALLQNQSAILTEIPNIWPVKGSSHISMYYGRNENPFTGQWYIHSGVDISTYRTGDPVVSTADGRVAAIGYDANLGNYIVVQHDHGFLTGYGHLMAFRVSIGQKVKQGQEIGLLGNTGLTTGPASITKCISGRAS